MMGYPNVEPPRGWFADIGDEGEAPDRFPWQPNVQVNGLILPLTVWFETREQCEEFIRCELVGLGWLDGPHRYPCPDCGAGSGDWCVNLTTGEKRHTFHADRMRYQFGGWPS